MKKISYPMDDLNPNRRTNRNPSGKVIFLGVDGTLLNYGKQLPGSARIAIREARKNGHKVYICTGRSEAEVYPIIWNIGLDGMIGGNGSYVKDGNTVILHQHLTKEQCKHIVDWCHSRQLEFYLECNSGLYASEHFDETALPVVQEYIRRKGRDDIVSLKDVFPELIIQENLYRDDVNKVSFILNSYQDHLDSVKEFPELQAGTWGGLHENALFGDLGVKGITKRTAIDELLKHLCISRENTIAIGDKTADIPMFEACACSVAMGSGSTDCKEAADYITDGVDDDGLYKAFFHLGLIEE